MALFSQNRWLKITVRLALFFRASGSLVSEFTINDLKQNSTNRVEPIIFNQSLFNLSEDEVTHCIFINGSKKEKKLYAIIELYSSIQFIIKLSDNYNGTDLQDVYIFDVIKRKEIHKELTYIPTYDYIFNFDFPSSEKNYSLFKQ